MVNDCDLQEQKSRLERRLSGVVGVHVCIQNFGKLPKLSRLVLFGSVVM